MSTLPLQLLVAALAGWANRVLREHLDGRRLLFPDVQRRRLATKAERISRQALSGIGPVVTPDPRVLFPYLVFL